MDPDPHETLCGSETLLKSNDSNSLDALRRLGTVKYFFMLSKKNYLAIQERVAIQVDVGVVNSRLAQGVANPLAGHGSAHQRH